nr:MAG TPA: Cytochrome c oxidase subunit IV [Ackermannviridae sp.]
MKWKDWQAMTPEQKQAAFTAYKKKWLATVNS